jgi:hypothetical protein
MEGSMDIEDNERTKRQQAFPLISLATLFMDDTLKKGRSIKIPSLGIEIKPEKVIVSNDD